MAKMTARLSGGPSQGLRLGCRPFGLLLEGPIQDWRAGRPNAAQPELITVSTASIRRLAPTGKGGLVCLPQWSQNSPFVQVPLSQIARNGVKHLRKGWIRALPQYRHCQRIRPEPAWLLGRACRRANRRAAGASRRGRIEI